MANYVTRNEDVPTVGTTPNGVWPVERAQEWQRRHGWLVGCNYVPAYAVNQIEMWQPETFDLGAIGRELGWAEGLGFNSVRVFLHDRLWAQDRDGFLERIDAFLGAAARHGVGAMLVPFDGVWDPQPVLGAQRPPRVGVHNSGWVQAPGAAILGNPDRHDEMEPYVTGLVRAFGRDPRVQAWDLFNEPDNRNSNAYPVTELRDKSAKALLLLQKAFAWARALDPSQPLTAGVWYGKSKWTPEKANPMQRFCLDNSDVLSFHNYEPLHNMRRAVEALRAWSPGRPLLCTEYMARGQRSLFDPHLAWMRENEVAAYNWGFVAGKSQTIYPWATLKRACEGDPDIWFHDIFRPDGTPYCPDEVAAIRAATGRGPALPPRRSRRLPARELAGTL